MGKVKGVGQECPTHMGKVKGVGQECLTHTGNTNPNCNAEVRMWRLGVGNSCGVGRWRCRRIGRRSRGR